MAPATRRQSVASLRSVEAGTVHGTPRGLHPLPSREEVIARADAKFSAMVREQDALSVEDAARAAAWPGGPSLESIVEHLSAVRDARARRARGEDVPPVPPLSLERAARMDAERLRRYGQLRSAS